MSSLLRAINSCLFGTDHDENFPASTDEQVKASNILQILFNAEEGGKDFKKKVDDIAGTYGWNERLGKIILGGVENCIKRGTPMGKAMKDATERAIAEAGEFAHDHPYFCALIAVGVSAILMPWILEVLGFAELGIVEGSFAAWWESTYGGYVPARSLFAFLQRLGMVWRRSVVKHGL